MPQKKREKVWEYYTNKIECLMQCVNNGLIKIKTEKWLSKKKYIYIYIYKWGIFGGL